MVGTSLFYIHYMLLLAFGILLSFVFSGVRLTKVNLIPASLLFVVCGLLQIAVYFTLDERTVWEIYPVITHLPLVLVLIFHYHKRLLTALAAVSAAYLCCQPAKWMGLLILTASGDENLMYITRSLTLLAVGFIMIFYLAAYLSELYNKDNQSVIIFGCIPMVYYIFDYTMSIYTDFWMSNNRTAIEFLPFFLCIVYLIFCVVYYRAYEQKADAERKEALIRITMDAMSREIETAKKKEKEIHLIRHDLRFFLQGLSACIENNDLDTARKMISGYVSNVDSITIRRYCSNSTVNYILSDFAEKCREKNIHSEIAVEIGDLIINEILFTSILSNALDNALNAQEGLPERSRLIKVALKSNKKQLLLSVRNTYAREPQFVDGLPVTRKTGHGYGVQSIRYMVERLGGTYQFTTDDGMFILRVVI